MNIAAGIFTVYFVLNLIRKRVVISREALVLLYLGIILPIGDYFLRLILGEIWFQTEGLVFHSMTYQALFWGIAALLRWVYGRRIREAARLLLPLVGLLIYALFSLFSMENLSFLAPFSDTVFSLGWVAPGYLVPIIIFLVCWFTILWSELSDIRLSILAIFSLVVFIGYSGISYHRISNEVASVFPNGDIVSIIPANLPQTMWHVVTFQQNKYTYSQFHFVQGQQGDIKEQVVSNQSDVSQFVLLDPGIRKIFKKTFYNPVVQIDIHNESMLISITELVPLAELLWVKQIQIRKNKSGQMVHFEVEYGTIF